MRLHDFGRSFWIAISARETEYWARRWPYSTLRGKRLTATFDRNGLCDLTVNGKRPSDDLDGNELSAIVSDFAAKRIKPGHPCYFVAIGQFKA